MQEGEQGFKPVEINMPDSAALVGMMKVTSEMIVAFHGNESSDDHELSDAGMEEMKRSWAEKIHKELPALINILLSGSEFAVSTAIPEISDLLKTAGVSLDQLVGQEVAHDVISKMNGKMDNWGNRKPSF